MQDLATVDAIGAAVLGLATLRGLWIGAVREAFSLAGLGLAVFVARGWRVPAGAWLGSHVEMTELAARVIAAAALGAGTLLAVSIVSRLVYRGVREAGLRLADRFFGALLGALEGSLVVGALLFGLIALLGRHDGALAGTRSLAAYEWVESALGIEPPPAPPGSAHAPPVSGAPPAARPARPSGHARG